MSTRQPTEFELGLIAKICPDVEVEDGELLWVGQGRFDPLYRQVDLARLVEAMQAAGHCVNRIHRAAGNTQCIVAIAKPAGIICTLIEATDLDATFWTCVDALKKAKD